MFKTIRRLINGHLAYFIASAMLVYVYLIRLTQEIRRNDFVLDGLDIDFIERNKKLFPERGFNKNCKILMDCFPIPLWIAANSVLAKQLADEFNAEICSFGISKRDSYTDAMYRSFGAKSHLIVGASLNSKVRRRKIFIEAFLNIKSKSDLYNWKIDGVQVGDEIFETYLRTFNQPTININSLRYLYLLLLGIDYYLFFRNIFENTKIVACILSHDIYINSGILAKISWANGVPVYMGNGLEIKRTMSPKHKYSEFLHYRELFALLPEDEKKLALDWSRQQLDKRLAGTVGVNMGYSTKSAYAKNKINRQTSESDSLKIVIATHCFFDNPRGYGGTLFVDFYEWLTFLGGLSNQTDYDWYIKLHRDFLPGTLSVVQELTTKFPKLKIINSETSWHQLREEGVMFALTCYGSIGHELPLLGYKVINAGYNPHIAYPFNWHPSNLEEYKNIILNLKELGEISSPELIYEFYFAHHKLLKRDGIVFDSVEEMDDYLKVPGVHSNLIFKKLLMMPDDIRVEKEKELQQYIQLGLFRSGEQNHQQYFHF